MPTLVLRAFGRTVSLSGPADALHEARQSLPPNYREGSTAPERRWAVRRSGPVWSATVDGSGLGEWRDTDGAVRAVLSDLELWVAEHASGRVLIHAGCVVFGKSAVVVPGRSMTGKTSLTAALVRAGGSYYSDEYAVLDAKGMVRPYARRLAMRPPGGGPAQRVAVEELGGRPGRGPATVGLIAELRYDPAAGWAVDRLGAGGGALRLIDNAVAGRSRPRAVLSAVTSAASGAVCISGTRGDADATARLLLALLPGRRE